VNAEQVFDILREAMIVTLTVAGPPMAIGLVVGIIISLFQAMTQIQEMTLTFVPKLITLFVTMVVFMPFMLATMIKFTEFIFDKIIAGGGT
jgi:flagellar biosynthetic protein FliQ